MNCITLFAGGGLKTLGAVAAGFNPVLSVEWNGNPKIGPADAIAQVYAANLGGVHLRNDPVQQIPDAVYSRFWGVDLFLLSPPCIRASEANRSSGETHLDGELAEHAIRAIRLSRPRAVLLENVPGYRCFKACQYVIKHLRILGYGVTVDVVNAADFGVPQTRVRLIIRGILGGEPPALVPTHARQANVFTDQWRGWYEAVADLLPDCEEAELADWQIRRLPEWLSDSLMIAQGGRHGQVATRGSEDPALTITANHNQTSIRAVLGGCNGQGGELFRESRRDAATLTADGCGKLRAILVEGDNSSRNGPLCRESAVPSPTVSTVTRSFAVLVSNKQAGAFISGTNRPPQTTLSDRPAPTVTSGGGESRDVLRAILVNDSTDLTIRTGEDPSPTVGAHRRVFTRCAVMVGGGSVSKESVPLSFETDPAFTIKASPKECHRAAVLNPPRIVRLSVPCLARFQTVPDGYVFPARRSLAATVIGNGVPCLLAEVLCRQLGEALSQC